MSGTGDTGDDPTYQHPQSYNPGPTERLTLFNQYIATLSPTQVQEKLGSYLANLNYLPDGWTLDAVPAAMEAWQSKNGLSPSGILDDESKVLMSYPRCGVPDFPEKPTVGRTLADVATRGWPSNPRQGGAVWPVQTFYWQVVQYPENALNAQWTTQRMVDLAIEKALNQWQANTHFYFTKAGPNTPAPNMWMKWCGKTHTSARDSSITCPAELDGTPWFSSNTLAHSFMGSLATLKAEIHYDEADDWNNWSRQVYVTMHEIGHVLGLDHSPVSSSVMYASSPWINYPEELDTDDVNAIHGLYPY